MQTPTLGHAGGAANLVPLDRDHPGFRDPAYRLRRDSIAQAALDYAGGDVPRVEYVEAEHQVWAEVWRQLTPLHQELAPRGFLVLHHRLGLDRERLPQLADVNPRLTQITGFRMEPVAGLVTARTFLSYLVDGVFLSTQYIRHHSAPLYTPEPDVVHELIGHAASFTHPMIAALNRSFGRAALEAGDEEISRLERAYWWTMEFGALEEAGEVKAFGAGLLSSIGEIQRLRGDVELRPFDVPELAATDYDPTNYQPVVFVAKSWEDLYYDLSTWLDEGGWRS